MAHSIDETNSSPGVGLASRCSQLLLPLQISCGGSEHFFGGPGARNLVSVGSIVQGGTHKAQVMFCHPQHPELTERPPLRLLWVLFQQATPLCLLHTPPCLPLFVLRLLVALRGMRLSPWPLAPAKGDLSMPWRHHIASDRSRPRPAQRTRYHEETSDHIMPGLLICTLCLSG